jgi:DNA-binding response OmpR family regulator
VATHGASGGELVTASEPLRVLIVEDDPDISLIEQMVLAKAGFATTIANRGDEAVGIVRAERPDVVLLDLMIPGCDGWAVLAELTAVPEPPTVIVCSARGAEDDVGRAREMGASDFVAKPFDIEEIVEAVRAAARGRGGVSVAAR